MPKGQQRTSTAKAGSGSTALNPKQATFVAEYLTDLNATRAAIAAGYSPKTAESQACQLLNNPKVSAAIAKKQGERLGKLEITADRVLQELAKLAFYDPRKFFDEDGRCKPISELDDETAAVIAGMKTVQKVIGEEKDGMVVFTDFKLADKGINLERLGKHLKLFTDGDKGPTINVNIPVSLEIDL